MSDTNVGGYQRLNGIRFADQFLGSDMGAKINAGINDLVAQGIGGTVYVPAGTSDFSTTVNFANGITVQGAGQGATILNYLGTGTAFSMMTVTGARVAHLQLITSTGISSTVAIKIYGVRNTVEDVLITGGTTTNGFATGIWVTGFLRPTSC